jgi:hypothetical protein
LANQPSNGSTPRDRVHCCRRVRGDPAKSTALFLISLCGALLTAGGAQAALVIGNAPTTNVTCTAGVCTATAKQAVLNAAQLQSMLASMDVEVSGGSEAKDVFLSAPLSWTSNSRLTIDAPHSIVFHTGVTISGTGALTLTFNESGTTGTLSFVKDASVVFWDLSSSLVINGAAYTLIRDIGTLAADIASNPAGNYALATDYDASVAGTYAHPPIPTTFGGAFEGLGNNIANLTMHGSSTDDTALFSALGPTGTIENLSILHVLVRAKSNRHTRGLAGLVAANSGRLFGDFVEGIIHDNGGHFVGALAGSNAGAISNCHSAGKVETDSGTGAAGGLVGANSSSVVTCAQPFYAWRQNTLKRPIGIDAVSTQPIPGWVR